MAEASQKEENTAATCKRDFDAVVILHGLGRTSANMSAVEKRLEAGGYTPYNLSYPSVTKDISALSAWLARELKEQDVWQKHSAVHFVTHSMGGIVVGNYLGAHMDDLEPNKMGRAVMMGVPHGGSAIADLLHETWAFQRIFGPAGQQLTTEFRKTQPFKPWYDLGVIAGTSNWNYPIGGLIMDGDHDGRVSVESTKIPDMKDHIALPVQHWSMVYQDAVLDQIEHFLAEGEFKILPQGNKNNGLNI